MSFILNKGPYCGDISALCLISCPSVSATPFLLAGTGPQLLLFDLSSGKLLQSLFCFDGVRVHGICAVGHQIHALSEIFTPTAIVAVHGENIVKLFRLLLRKGGGWELQLQLLHSLPKLTHWVLDALFVQQGSSSSSDKPDDEDGRQPYLAVGLTDNSLSLWDIQVPSLVYRVESTERCLLYSMRLWGTSLDTLRVAAGTIFNEVLIWKAGKKVSCVSKVLSKSSSSFGSKVDRWSETSDAIIDEPVTPLQRLIGHEGSVHRISWSPDGLRIISVSDDRSARVWKHKCDQIDVEQQAILGDNNVEEGPVLYGHGGRVWDCHFTEQLLVTASEDCTCRLWAPDGRHLTTLRGHTGRGVWRCAYDRDTSILVTAGADSAIRVASLSTWTVEGPIPALHGSKECTEVFSISSQPTGNCLDGGVTSYIDSKSEYIRCVSLAGPLSLYVATNRGCLHRVDLPRNGKEHWTTYASGYMEGPIVCMDVLFSVAKTEKLIPNDDLSEHIIAVGNGKGQARVLKLDCTELHSEIAWNHPWQAEAERKLLGVFWCKSLGSSCVFTTDPRGGLRVWSIHDNSQPVGAVARICESTRLSAERLCVSLMASCQSPTHNQIMCLDVCLQRQVIVCGEKRGNLVVASFPSSLEQANQGAPMSLVVLAVLKGAHGISGVTSIMFRSGGSEFVSTGKDGCICKFMSDKSSSSQGYVCTGVDKVQAITNLNSLTFSGEKKLAAGFTASDFIVWDAQQQSELMRVPCGGWRRPFSFICGISSEPQICLAFVKDHVIHIQRKWNSSFDGAGGKYQEPCLTSAQFSTDLLHAQFHGKEIQSVQFVRGLSHSTITSEARTDSSWIATGAEDGTVRLTRFAPKPKEHIDTSLVLGEHTGGSAVRALAVVSDVHLISQHAQPHEVSPLECLSWINEESLLVSVGAKEVLTCWRLQWSSMSFLEGATDSSPLIAAEDHSSGSTAAIATQGDRTLIYSWLTSCRPQNPRSMVGRAVSTDFQHHPSKVTESKVEPPLSKQVPTVETGNDDMEGVGTSGVRSQQEEPAEDDLRYMAVTAFLTICCHSGLSFMFVVTASSDTSLTVQAFNLSSRSWLKVASLHYHTSPVLALTHLVVQSRRPVSDESSKRFLLFSGATDGCIAVWDITSVVVRTLRDAYGDGPCLSTSTSLRPPSGRGSQGGRRKRVDRYNEEAKEVVPDVVAEVSNLKQVESTVHPIQIFAAAHLSGVNCLSVQKLQEKESYCCSSRGADYVLVSGGDDEAMHAVTFSVEGFPHRSGGELRSDEGTGPSANVDPRDMELKDSTLAGPRDHGCTVFVGCRVSVPCAHYSALKGVWTDGKFIFSTGLDQRLRCWVLTRRSSEPCRASQSTANGSLLSVRECAHSVIDVPEAAALHVEVGKNGSHRIAVAGRGLQILTFDKV